MTTGRKLIEAIAVERSRQTDKYDPLLVALGRAMAPQINARLADLERELAEKKKHTDGET